MSLRMVVHHCFVVVLMKHSQDLTTNRLLNRRISIRFLKTIKSHEINSENEQKAREEWLTTTWPSAATGPTSAGFPSTTATTAAPAIIPSAWAWHADDFDNFNSLTAMASTTAPTTTVVPSASTWTPSRRGTWPTWTPTAWRSSRPSRFQTARAPSRRRAWPSRWRARPSTAAWTPTRVPATWGGTSTSNNSEQTSKDLPKKIPLKNPSQKSIYNPFESTEYPTWVSSKQKI